MIAADELPMNLPTSWIQQAHELGETGKKGKTKTTRAGALGTEVDEAVDGQPYRPVGGVKRAHWRMVRHLEKCRQNEKNAVVKTTLQ